MEVLSISSGDEDGNQLNDHHGSIKPSDTVSSVDSLSAIICVDSRVTSLSTLPQSSDVISLSNLSLTPPSTEDGDEPSRHQVSSDAATAASATTFPPLFTGTKWIHFTVEHSLSYEYPLSRMLPCNHKVSFRLISRNLSPPVLRHTLFAHGFAEVKGAMATIASITPPTLTWSCSSIRVDHVKYLKGHQKINHFIKIQSITRKDHLCENIERMQTLKGFRHFNITPKTFVLPKEMTEFQEAHKKLGGSWILKPASLSRGRGIRLITHPRQINIKELTVISRYIDNPFCINGLKFDLRLYVLITSIDPLRIYLFEEGLGRFASETYRREPCFHKNLRMHLTNYSLNKGHSDYVFSSDPDRDDVGNKWSSSAIFRYLRDLGYNVDKLLASIEDVIIKTIVAGEMQICTGLRFQHYHGNCFELLGFDILLDSSLKPWVLEVNMSPSLMCDTPLDLKIKSKLIADTFSLIGVELPVKTSTKGSTKRGCAAPDPYSKFRIGSKFEDTSILLQTKEEHRRRGGFVRIFPTNETWDLYSSFLESKTKLNYSLHRGLYPENGRIKWPPSSVGASIDLSLRLRNSLTNNSRQRSVKSSNVAGLDLIERVKVYLNGLSLDSHSLLSSTGFQMYCGRISGKFKLNSDLQFECIVSVYVNKLIEEILHVMDPDSQYHIQDSLSTERLMNSMVSFLNSAAGASQPSTAVLPDQFLSLSIRFRMIAQQLKEFLSSFNEKIANNIKDDERVDSEKSFLEKSPITNVESLIIGHNSSQPFLRYLVDLVKCMKSYRITESTSKRQPIVEQPTESCYHISTTAMTRIRPSSSAKMTREIKPAIRTAQRKKSRIMYRPQSVSPAPSPSLTAESKLFGQSYKSLPCKLESIDSDLCRGTREAIPVALQKFPISKQLAPSRQK